MKNKIETQLLAGEIYLMHFVYHNTFCATSFLHFVYRNTFCFSVLVGQVPATGDILVTDTDSHRLVAMRVHRAVTSSTNSMAGSAAGSDSTTVPKHGTSGHGGHVGNSGSTSGNSGHCGNSGTSGNSGHCGKSGSTSGNSGHCGNSGNSGNSGSGQNDMGVAAGAPAGESKVEYWAHRAGSRVWGFRGADKHQVLQRVGGGGGGGDQKENELIKFYNLYFV
jgi:hypothetical protein